MSIELENLLYRAARKGFPGFWSDLVKIDRHIVERNKCDGCKKYFVYVAWSNATEYRAFGVCDACKRAKLYNGRFGLLRDIKFIRELEMEFLNSLETEADAECA
jgi:hypothetical protein